MNKKRFLYGAQVMYACMINKEGRFPIKETLVLGQMCHHGFTPPFLGRHNLTQAVPAFTRILVLDSCKIITFYCKHLLLHTSITFYHRYLLLHFLFQIVQCYLNIQSKETYLCFREMLLYLLITQIGVTLSPNNPDRCYFIS